MTTASQCKSANVVRDEQGFTLAEVMVTCLMLTIVLFALYSIFDQSLRIFSIGNNKLEAVETARTGIEKMERELRNSYPVDRIGHKQHVFFTAGASAAPVAPTSTSITFGNDFASGVTPPNRRIDSTEEITYELRDRTDLNNACPTSGIEGKCMLVRRLGSSATFQPVVDRVVPNGLTLSYYSGFDASGNPIAATSSNGMDIRMIRIKLRVNVNGQPQMLTTDVDLRNR